MLTSSDAKFRCLWHMFTWSIMLTLVSQFYILTDHIAFYIFGSLCVVVLPFVTSVYSTTGGQRGSSLLRVAYVLCDPVLACMSVVPVLLLNRLTPLIHEMECLGVDIKSWNETLSCLGNNSMSNLEAIISHGNLTFSRKAWIWLEKKNLLTAIQASIIIPCILALFMGRRSRKMSYTTALTSFTYWLVTSIECATLIETTLLCGYSKVHFAVTTQVTVCVACILANSYATVTLCSYLSPMTCKGDKTAVKARFDVIFKCIVGVTGVVFVEIPQLVARFQMMASASDWPSEEMEFEHLLAAEHKSMNVDAYQNTSSPPAVRLSMDRVVELSGDVPGFDLDDIYNSFPTSFYMWAFKDGIMIVVIIASLVLQKFGQSPPILLRILGEGRNCAGAAFDNPDTFFVPEKRDKYIVTHCGKLQDPDFRDGAPKLQSYPERMISQDSVEESCFFLPRRNNKMSLLTSIRHKKLKKDIQIESDTTSSEGKTDGEGELIALSPISLFESTSSEIAADNSANNLKEDLLPPFKNGPPEDQQNVNGKRKKTVKFSFSDDHILNDNIEGGGYQRIHPRGPHLASTGSILVNSSCKGTYDRNNKTPTDGLPQRPQERADMPPDVLGTASIQVSSTFCGAGDSSNNAVTRLPNSPDTQR